MPKTFSRRKRSRSRSKPRFKKTSFKRRVKAIVRGTAEKKYLFKSLLNEEFDQTGHRHYLSTVAEGTGPNDRVGRSITPHYFAGNFELLLGSGATSGALATRVTYTVLLVRDKQQVGDNPAAVSEILAEIGTQAAPMGMINAANRGRFQIMRRWSGTLHYYKPCVYLRLFHKLKGFSMRYNGSGTGDIERNGMQLIFISSALGSEDMCYATGHCRLYFTDV